MSWQSCSNLCIQYEIWAQNMVFMATWASFPLGNSGNHVFLENFTKQVSFGNFVKATKFVFPKESHLLISMCQINILRIFHVMAWNMF
jgi:hypothetical protein